MNFSNFIIDKLFESASSLTQESKKFSATPFLFSDIIKVCEQEKLVQAAEVSEKEKPEQSLEVFAQTENVIKISPEEFAGLSQLISSMISNDVDLQPTETSHKIDDAEITKLQFILPEEKLIELTGELIDKTSFSLIPLSETAEPIELAKPLSVSYKSGSNKLSVAINLIKVDGNYTNNIIRDEYNFVNKLIVNGGLLQNNSFTQPISIGNDEEKKVFPENSLTEVEDELDASTTKETELNKKVFYKVEVIKIETPSFVANKDLLNVPLKDKSFLELVNVSFQNIENQKPADLKAFPDQQKSTPINLSDKLVERSSVNKVVIQNNALLNNPNNSSVNTEIAKTVNDNPNVQTKSNILNEQFATAETKNTEHSQKHKKVLFVNQLKSDVEKAGLDYAQNSGSLNKLLEGLTDDEKSVFKGFVKRGELNAISYKKTNGLASEATVTKETQQTGSVINLKAEEKIEVADNSTVNEVVKPAETIVNTNAKKLDSSYLEFTNKTKASVSKENIAQKSKANILNIGVEQNELAQNSEEVIEQLGIVKADSELKKIISVDAESEVPTKTQLGEAKVQQKAGNTNLAAHNEQASKEELLKETIEKFSKKIFTAKTEDKKNIFSKVELPVEQEVGYSLNNEILSNSETDLDTKKLSQEKANVDFINESVDVHKQKAKQENVSLQPELSIEGKLFVKVSSKAKINVEKSTKEEIQPKNESNSLKEINNAENERVVKGTEKLSVEAIKSNVAQNEKGEQTIPVEKPEVISALSNEKNIQTKNESDLKAKTTAQLKEVNHSSEQQLTQQNEKDSGKTNTSESFKHHFTQNVTTEKGFDLESIKQHIDLKQAQETFKTVKQQEILPEFSKLILQGEKQTLTLQLTPENLGKVKLTVDMVENQIVTKIEVENEQVKQFVQSNVEQLKQNMQSAGIALTNVNVSLSDEQKNQKVFTQKKKTLSREDKEEVIEETTMLKAKKHMGYNTYEFTA